MIDPEKETYYIVNDDEPIVMPETAVTEEVPEQFGIRGGPGIRIFEPNADLYGHKGYGYFKGWDD